MVTTSIAAINRWDAYDQRTFRKWFGTHNVAVRATIRAGYAVIGSVLTQPLVWHYTSEDQYAHTHPYGGFEIWFGHSFWEARPVGPNSQAGTVVHETSHIALDTNDEAYGRALCAVLAANRPRVAQQNADNWEFFAEDAL
jgi:peptidyl-Lys metalloendopeptidase